MNCIRHKEHLQCPRWHKKFQDGFINHKDGSPPGQPVTVVTYIKIAVVAGIVKRDTRLTLKILPIVLAYYQGQLIRF